MTDTDKQRHEQTTKQNQQQQQQQQQQRKSKQTANKVYKQTKWDYSVSLMTNLYAALIRQDKVLRENK